jgi:putative DNA primase/helicase
LGDERVTNTFATLSHPKAGKPVTNYIYRNQDGEPVLIANRFNKPDGGKFFVPFDVTRSEWKAPETRPLYNLDKIMQTHPAEPVILVEGEKCADALTALGYLATTTYGGCNALRKADLSPLRRRTVMLWPDLDPPGLSYVGKAALTLHRDFEAVPKVVPITETLLCNVMIDSGGNLPINPPMYCKGWDAADAIAEGWGNTLIDRLLSYGAPLDAANANAAPTDANNTASPAASDLADIEVWKTPDGEPYATLRLDGHFEYWPITSPTFKKYLSFQHYQATEKMLSQSALDDQRRTYEGQALFGSDTHPVFNRIGTLGRTLYVDLGCDDWKAIAINSEGWQIIHHPPARFTRARSMQPLPHPAMSGGDINLLRPFLNTASEADFQMLIAWLIGCFHPKGPYPILILNGEQGSAKSTTARVLRNLIDPANPIARSAPNSEQDLVIAAKHNHVLAFDNLSTIKPMMADAFCRIATGGGFGTRKLHTDADEMLFSATRPCLLNGIPDLAGRPDLADRAIVVTLPVIAPTDRAFEGEFNKALDAAMPRILAGLLDGVSTALANLASVRLSERPRMADFAKWVSAAEPALGWTQGAFLAAYAANRDSGDRATVEGNSVGLAILKLVQDDVRWSGTMTELKSTLRNRYPLLTDDPYSFPRQENKLSAAIRRIIPPLRRTGVEISFERRGASGERILRIERT